MCSTTWSGRYHSADENNFLVLQYVWGGMVVKPYKIENSGLGSFPVRKFGNGETDVWYYCALVHIFFSVIQ